MHWSHGSFGYFPTYSLGSFYAAQFFEAAKKQLPALENDITNGDTRTLLDWLRTHIHAAGRRFTSSELCERLTGEPLNIDYFLDYSHHKFKAIYHY